MRTRVDTPKVENDSQVRSSLEELLAGVDIEMLEKPDFVNERWTWVEFVPKEVQAVWGELTLEARVCIYLTASEASWENVD